MPKEHHRLRDRLEKEDDCQSYPHPQRLAAQGVRHLAGSVLVKTLSFAFPQPYRHGEAEIAHARGANVRNEDGPSRGPSVIKNSPWFQGLVSFALALAREILEAANSCGRISELARRGPKDAPDNH